MLINNGGKFGDIRDSQRGGAVRFGGNLHVVGRIKAEYSRICGSIFKNFKVKEEEINLWVRKIKKQELK